jgi:hypothetical protein
MDFIWAVAKPNESNDVQQVIFLDGNQLLLLFRLLLWVLCNDEIWERNVMQYLSRVS